MSCCVHGTAVEVNCSGIFSLCTANGSTFKSRKFCAALGLQFTAIEIKLSVRFDQRMTVSGRIRRTIGMSNQLSRISALPVYVQLCIIADLKTFWTSQCCAVAKDNIDGIGVIDIKPAVDRRIVTDNVPALKIIAAPAIELGVVGTSFDGVNDLFVRAVPRAVDVADACRRTRLNGNDDQNTDHHSKCQQYADGSF